MPEKRAVDLHHDIYDMLNVDHLCIPDRFELAYEIGSIVTDELQKLYDQLIDHCAVIEPGARYRDELRNMKEYFERNK